MRILPDIVDVQLNLKVRSYERLLFQVEFGACGERSVGHEKVRLRGGRVGPGQGACQQKMYQPCAGTYNPRTTFFALLCEEIASTISNDSY